MAKTRRFVKSRRIGKNRRFTKSRRIGKNRRIKYKTHKRYINGGNDKVTPSGYGNVHTKNPGLTWNRDKNYRNELPMRPTAYSEKPDNKFNVKYRKDLIEADDFVSQNLSNSDSDSDFTEPAQMEN